MIDDKTEAVLRSIFDPSMSESEPGNLGETQRQPVFDEVLELAKLLGADAPEEALQQCLSLHPHLLLRALPTAGNGNLAVLTKPPVGTKYCADFAVLTYGQGGCYIELVELERAIDPLFTKAGTPARRLQGAIGQVQDWHQWIVPNRTSFVRDLVSRAMSCPVYPTRAENGSFALKSADDLEAAWRGFSGFDHAMITYTVVIGRWSLLSREDQARLVFLNQEGSWLCAVRTYDQIVRRAYDGPPIFW